MSSDDGAINKKMTQASSEKGRLQKGSHSDLSEALCAIFMHSYIIDAQNVLLQLHKQER